MIFLYVLQLALSCPQDSEESVISGLASNSFQPTNECIKQVQQKGWYDAATQLVIRAVELEIQLDASLKIEALAVKRKIEKYITALENSSNLQVVAPAYQWAQSPSMVFLDIKFSHRLDSPGCLEVVNSDVKISAERLTFSANCARSTQRIKLNLELEFYTDIDVEGSSYSFTSVGRLNVNIKKKEESAWPKPMKGKKPSNVHTWWEMKEKYQKIMNKFTGDEDEDDRGSSKKSPEGLMNDKDDL